MSVSYTRKVNLGNYESADVFFAISGVPVGATKEQIDEALVTGEVAYDVVKAAVAHRAIEIRNAAALAASGTAKGARR